MHRKGLIRKSTNVRSSRLRNAVTAPLLKHIPKIASNATKKSSKLSLPDKLSRLSYAQTVKLLGGEAVQLLRCGNNWDFNLDQDAHVSEDLFRLNFPEGENGSAKIFVTISLAEDAYDRLLWKCSACESLCEHIGATFSLILDEKMSLGLAAPPAERTPVESLSETELVERAIEERRERAASERMTIQTMDASQPWTDYTATSTVSGKSYRVSVRGRDPGQSYCSCPDFRTNTLGTCKHR
jgi:hypothetical protein